VRPSKGSLNSTYFAGSLRKAWNTHSKDVLIHTILETISTYMKFIFVIKTVLWVILKPWNMLDWGLVKTLGLEWVSTMDQTINAIFERSMLIPNNRCSGSEPNLNSLKFRTDLLNLISETDNRSFHRFGGWRLSREFLGVNIQARWVNSHGYVLF